MNGSTISSPVSVKAASAVSGTTARMELRVDGMRKYTASSNSINTSISLAAGSHRFAVIAVDTAGQKWENPVNASEVAELLVPSLAGSFGKGGTSLCHES